MYLKLNLYFSHILICNSVRFVNAYRSNRPVLFIQDMFRCLFDRFVDFANSFFAIKSAMYRLCYKEKLHRFAFGVLLGEYRLLDSPMGCNFSKSYGKIPTYKDYTLLASQTFFSVNEVEALYVLFEQLSSSIIKDGLIHKDELGNALLTSGKKANLFVDRVFDVFDYKNTGVIEFEEFVRSLSVFHPNASQGDKIAFAFKLYDLRQTGYIEREEVKDMIVAILEESDVTLPDELIEAMVEKTFVEVDSKLDGRIDKQEWKDFVAKYPSLMKNMTIPSLRDITTSFPSFLGNSQVPDSDLVSRVHESIEKSEYFTSEW